ncbi:hypothetical protein KKH56_03565, partial [bacterium]|nr:hypothetical protein [bacterium]
KATSKVKTIFDRYRDYLRGREKLGQMAYTCLTEFCGSDKIGNKIRKEIGERYKVEENILKKLGELSSTRGNAGERRKAPPKGGNYQPFTSNEKEWIKLVIKELIIRLGKYEWDPNTPFKKLTMNDFPQI